MGEDVAERQRLDQLAMLRGRQGGIVHATSVGPGGVGEACIRCVVVCLAPAARGVGWGVRLWCVSAAWTWEAGGNCSIRSVTRRRYAVVGRLMLPNPRWVDSPHVVSPQARVERRADLRNKLVRMIEVVPADADDVPALGFEVALTLALAGQ